MPNKISRFKKTALVVALVILGIPIFVWGFSVANRPAFVRTYFWLEQKWVDHWPVPSQKWAIQDLAPYAIRMGLLSPIRKEVEPGVSFLLDPRDLVSVSILRGGAWQPEIWESLAASLSEGSVFLDVGAHIGYLSMKAAVKVGAPGRVISFEPNPETLKLLRENVAVNRAQNVIVEPIACTEREQTLTLYAGPPSNTGMSSLAKDNVPVEGSQRLYSVRGRPIDDIVRELKLARVDAIKIDVEGAEAIVLRGALATLKRFHPKIVVEVVKEQLAKLGATPEELAALLRSAGYNQSKPLNSPVTDWEWTVQ